jgi:hypothetical protein
MADKRFNVILPWNEYRDRMGSSTGNVELAKMSTYSKCPVYLMSLDHRRSRAFAAAQLAGRSDGNALRDSTWSTLLLHRGRRHDFCAFASIERAVALEGLGLAY